MPKLSRPRCTCQRHCPTVTPAEVREALRTSGLTYQEAATKLGIGIRTLTRWCQQDGKKRIANPAMVQALRELR